MTDQGLAAVAKALASTGQRVLRCRRGGLLIDGNGQRYRLIDEPGAPELTVRRVVDLVGYAGMPPGHTGHCSQRHPTAIDPMRVEPIVPLEAEQRPAVPTRIAAHYLCRKDQTLRVWAAFGGPIKPVRFGNRLLWPTAEIRRLLASHEATTA